MCLQCLSKVHGDGGRESMDVTAEQDGEMDAHVQNDFLLPEAEGTC